MTRSAFAAVLALVVGPQAFAADAVLTEQQQLGLRLYEQACGVCHTRPTLIAGMYGPELSKNSAGGNEELMREVIANGTPRMPGFKLHFKADEIAAIAAYLKTLPPGIWNLPENYSPAATRQ